MTKTFDKKALFAAIKPKTQQHSVEGFGEVGVVQLSVAQVEEIRESMKKDEKGEAFGLLLVVQAVVDGNGARIFEESDIADLKASSNNAVDAMVAKALEVNGLKKAPEAKN